jgi:hypothetical protein
MIVWGGSDGMDYLNSGGSYHPASNSWSTVTTMGAPSVRSFHTAVWTGSEMIVWGGESFTIVNDTFSYTPGRTMYLYQRP